MRPCRTIDLSVPASADIVIEGRILPHERRPEGPFGEFMGYYVEVGDNHVFEVTHVGWRKGAVFHGLICGSKEDLRPLEAATAARIYQALKAQVPGVLDVSCQPTVMNTIIKIRKQYEGHGGHALLAAMGSHLDYNKFCVVVDEDVDLYDMEEVVWAFVTRGRADTRSMVVPNVPGFYRDPHKDHWGRLALADSSRPVVAVAGDGCFLMHAEELATAVQEGLKILVVVVNNAGYGAIRGSQMRLFGRAVGTDLRNPSFADYARAFGAHAERVETTDGFLPALERARAAAGPALIELVVPASVGKPA